MFTQLLAEANTKRSHYNPAQDTRAKRRSRRVQRLSSRLAA